VATVREVHLGRGKEGDGVQLSALAQRLEPHAAVRPHHPKAAGLVLDVRGRYFESLCGKAAPLRDDFPDRTMDGAARHRGRARCDRGDAGGHLAAVALQDADAGGVEAQQAGGQQGLSGRKALSHPLGSRPHDHATIRQDAEVRALRQWGATGDLQEAADPDSAEPAFARRVLASRGKPVPVGQGERLVQNDLELAAVIALSAGCRIRHRVGRYQVAPPQLHSIDAGDPRRIVDQALDHVDGFRPAGATVGTERRCIRQDHLRADVDRGNAIDARQAVLRIVRRDDRDVGGRVRADPDERAKAKGEEATGVIQREFSIQQAVTAVRVGQEALEPGCAPADRSTASACREEQRRILGIGLHLHAESAADIVRQDPDGIGFDAEHRPGQDLADYGYALGAGG